MWALHELHNIPALHDKKIKDDPKSHFKDDLAFLRKEFPFTHKDDVGKKIEIFPFTKKMREIMLRLRALSTSNTGHFRIVGS